MRFGIIEKYELQQLIKDDILSKWNQEEETLYEFMENYISEDIQDYENATGLKLLWHIKETDDDDFIVRVEVVEQNK